MKTNECYIKYRQTGKQFGSQRQTVAISYNKPTWFYIYFPISYNFVYIGKLLAYWLEGVKTSSMVNKSTWYLGYWNMVDNPWIIQKSICDSLSLIKNIKSPATRLFDQQLLQTINKKIIKALHWPFAKENHRSPVDSPYNGASNEQNVSLSWRLCWLFVWI